MALIATFVFPAFENRPNVGCYWTDAMIVFVECKNTGWDQLATTIASLPIYWLTLGWLAIPGGIAALIKGQWVGFLVMISGVFWFYALWQLITLMLTLMALTTNSSRRKE
ncbi:MAG: hypothetical protein ABI898_04585 [Sphingomonadales bacterium]